MADPDYRVQERWKEEVVYWEGDRGCLFDGAWGVTPHYVYIPSEDIWDDVVPPWLRGRFGVVRDRLAASGQVVRPTPEGYGRPLPTLHRDGADDPG